MTNRFGTVLRRSAMVCMVGALGLAGSAPATLLDRGPDLVYDDVLNLTWTRNANLPGSSGLNWADANNWAANLVFGGVDDWRLPYANVIERAGPTDSTEGSELRHMYYQNLEGQFLGDKTGNRTALGGQQLIDIQPFYWSGTAFKIEPSRAWGFIFGENNGGNDTAPVKVLELSAWAVRDGDINAVPEPSSLLLIGGGVLGLVWTRRNRRKVADH